MLEEYPTCPWRRDTEEYLTWSKEKVEEYLIRQWWEGVDECNVRINKQNPYIEFDENFLSFFKQSLPAVSFLSHSFSSFFYEKQFNKFRCVFWLFFFFLLNFISSFHICLTLKFKYYLLTNLSFNKSTDSV